MALAAALLPSLAWGAGFALFEHGNKGVAMGGAMVAIADDGSAIFWNPAGLSFQEHDGFQVMVGTTLIMPTQTFEGSNAPYPGPGYTVDQKDQVFYPPHMYAVMPLNETFTVGFGVNTPFGLGTHWDEDYAGRFISKRVDLRRVDTNVSLAVKPVENFSFGVGVTYAAAQIDLTRNIGIINPFTQQVADIGQVHMYTDGLGESAFGWNMGLMYKMDNGLSFATSYRSKIKIDMEGEASFTQYLTGYPELDATVAGMLPFDNNVPIKTAIDFPDLFNAAVAWENDDWTVAVQYGWMGWQSFQSLPINFPTRPDLSDELDEGYRNVSQYRFGLEYRYNEQWAFRGGLLYDDTPQPRSAMSPLFAGGIRRGISAGFGYDHDNWWVDVADLYLDVEDRSTHGMANSGFEGRYENAANLFGITFGMAF